MNLALALRRSVQQAREEDPHYVELEMFVSRDCRPAPMGYHEVLSRYPDGSPSAVKFDGEKIRIGSDGKEWPITSSFRIQIRRKVNADV